MKSIFRLCALLSIIMGSLIHPASAQLAVYMTLESASHGIIRVETERAKANGLSAEYLPVISIKTSTETLGRHPVARGEVEYKPVVVTRRVDEASPRILSCFTTKEALKKVVILYMGLHGDDVHAIYRRITLTDALITKVTRFDAPVNTNHNEHVAVQEEDVTLTFRGISIENLISSPTTLDNVTTNH